MNRFLSILLIMLVSMSVDAQDFDSLKRDALSEAVDSVRLSKLMSLNLKYINAGGEFDSVMRYADMALALADRLGDNAKKGRVYVMIGWEHMYADSPKALDYMFKALELYDSAGDIGSRVYVLRTIGAYFINTNNYGKAVEYTLMALNLAHNSHNSEYDAILYENLGTVNFNMEMYSTAMEYYQKAADCCLDSVNRAVLDLYMAESGYNMSYDRYRSVLLEEAAYKRLAEIAPEYSDQILEVFGNIVSVYIDLDAQDPRRDTVMAKIQHWLPLLDEVRTDFNEQTYYMDMVSYYTITDNRAKADRLLPAMLRKLANEDTPHIKDLFRAIIDYYKYIHDWQKVMKYTEDYWHLSAAWSNIEFSAQTVVAPVEIAYQENSRQAQLDGLRRSLDYEQQKQFGKLLRWATLALGSMVLMVLLIMAIDYRIQSHQSHKLAVQTYEIMTVTQELNQQKSEITSQRDQITSQAKDMDRQYHLVSATNNELLWSIHYASAIQQAIVPTSDDVREVFPDSFVLWKPLNIVSGDFYWVHQSGGRRYMVAADCTGHGVPGALLSMLGVSLLNDLSSQMDSMEAGPILDLLRERFLNVLSYNDNDVEDGMEMGIVIITDYELRNPNCHPGSIEHREHGITQNNTEDEKSPDEEIKNQKLKIKNDLDEEIKNQKLKIKNDLDEEIENQKLKIKNVLSYAGARRPLVLVRGGEARELKPDKKSICVSRYDVMKGPFNTQTMDLCDGDMLYMFSDGLVDQLGGPEVKRFGRSRFYDMLARVSDSKVEEQSRAIDAAICEWAKTCASEPGTSSQIDDQLVIGVRT